MAKLIKTREEIELIQEGGKILHEILRATAGLVQPGVSTHELNEYAEQQIYSRGGRPSFKGYGSKKNPFPAGLCTSVNDVVVHGIPSKREVLKNGDIISLDIGMEYKRLYTDHAITVPVGEVAEPIQKLLKVTETALQRGIAAAKIGARVGAIGAAIQQTAEAAGFSVVRDLVGHGVGHSVHEDPPVPCFGKPDQGPELKEGMVLAIEPMVCMGEYFMVFEADGWTVRTKDGSLAAHFEHTVAISKSGPRVLT